MVQKQRQVQEEEGERREDRVKGRDGQRKRGWRRRRLSPRRVMRGKEPTGEEEGERETRRERREKTKSPPTMGVRLLLGDLDADGTEDGQVMT